MTHYKTLSIHRSATPQEIKIAFRSKAAYLHPDVHGDDVAPFIMASNAFRELLHDKERYDKELDREYPQCGECAGQGFVAKQISFTTQIKTRCLNCEGSGVISS